MYDFNERQLGKLETLRELGIEPYPSGLRKPNKLGPILEEIEEYPIMYLREYPDTVLAGRLLFKNEMGKMGFGRIESEGDRIQFLVRRNTLSEEDWKAWRKLDSGDWVWIHGNFTRTRTGELTLEVDQLKLYAKCVEGMPDKMAGVTDPETRQRMRYLDLIVNPESRRTFETRFAVIKYIRRFLEDEGFVEVETPILQTLAGGASAKPFTTHHNALDAELYMRVAPELYLKRLVVGGFERVFEIGKNFRNEGISTRHNPEFTMVEFYQAHATYQDLMKMTQNLLVGLVGRINSEKFANDNAFAQKHVVPYTNSFIPSLTIPYGDLEIDFGKWGRVRYDELLRKVGVEDPWDIGSFVDFFSRTDDEVDLAEYNLSDEDLLSELQQLVFDRHVEPQLINPTFVTHYPASFSPLARRTDGEPRVTDRFELFIAGSEIANGFSELNDPVDQAERFARQAEMKAGGDDEAMFFDEDYIRALSYGMPPTAGEGIGIDRLVMLLTNNQSIRDVILFPTRKLK